MHHIFVFECRTYSEISAQSAQPIFPCLPKSAAMWRLRFVWMLRQKWRILCALTCGGWKLFPNKVLDALAKEATPWKLEWLKGIVINLSLFPKLLLSLAIPSILPNIRYSLETLIFRWVFQHEYFPLAAHKRKLAGDVRCNSLLLGSSSSSW